MTTKLVRVKAEVTDGAFSGEKHYAIVTANGETYRGMAPTGYCEREGYVNGVVVDWPESGRVAVSLPVYQGMTDTFAVPAASVVSREEGNG
jgi:hypothetical protein